MFKFSFFHRIVVVCLLVALGGLAAPTFWHLRGYDTIIPPQVHHASLVPTVQTPAVIEIDPILTLAPFGAQVQQSSPTGASQPVVPIKRRSLR